MSRGGASAGMKGQGKGEGLEVRGKGGRVMLCKGMEEEKKGGEAGRGRQYDGLQRRKGGTECQQERGVEEQ